MTYSFRTNGNFIDFVHTDNTNQAVESVLRSLHNTSRCVTWSLPEDTTRISFVVDDIRVDNFLLTEIDFDGVTIDSQDDFETGIIAAFPGLAGSGGGGGGTSYLVYTASITQSGTDDCVPNILQNTLGSLVYGTGTNGKYFYFTTTIDFDITKIWINGFAQSGNAGYVLMPIGSGSGVEGYYSVYAYNSSGKLLIEVDFYNISMVASALSSILHDNALFLPEIRIYP